MHDEKLYREKKSQQFFYLSYSNPYNYVKFSTSNFEHLLQFYRIPGEVDKKISSDGCFKKEIKFDWNQLRLASEIQGNVINN